MLKAEKTSKFTDFKKYNIYFIYAAFSICIFKGLYPKPGYIEGTVS